MNVKAISVNVGKALLVSALFMFLSMIVSLIDGRDAAFGPLLISFIVTLLVGSFPFIFVKNRQQLSLKDGFLTIVLSWVLSFIFGMMPYVMYGGEFTLINAWFESVSGYTTTGSTILNDIEALPRSLIFWRSSTHFIGGLGVVVFLLLVIPSANPYRLKLTQMEISSLSKEGYRYNSSKTMGVITRVYLSLTLAAFLSLWAAGMSFFDALNHAFSLVSTGGFSTRNSSIAAFDSELINFIVLFYMIVCAMHFGYLYASFATRSFKPFNNTVTKYYLGSIAFFSVVIMISLMSQGGYESWGKAAMDAAFTVASYMSTTGFAVCENGSWPLLAFLMLLLVSFQCGCAGSTTGGIKVDRVVISFKAFMAEIRHRLHPTSVTRSRLGGHMLSDKTLKPVLMYIVLYFLVTIVSVFAIMICGSDPQTAISGVVASIGSIGPGLGELGALENYSAQPSMAKFIYSVDMLLGRVEIYPVLVVFSMILGRERR